MKALLVILTLALAAVVPTAAAAPASLQHSRHVVQFFDTHSWLLAPNQSTCQEVPWTRSCRIARRIFRHHTNKLQVAWREYQYDWQTWLPGNWKAVASCETHFNWEHNNSSFVSAFGISWREYNADAAYMGAPPWHVRHTPRDQYLAALGHYKRFGDGWGCPGP